MNTRNVDVCPRDGMVVIKVDSEVIPLDEEKANGLINTLIYARNVSFGTPQESLVIKFDNSHDLNQFLDWIKVLHPAGMKFIMENKDEEHTCGKKPPDSSPSGQQVQG